MDAVVAIGGRVTGVIGGGAMVVVIEGGVVEVVVLIGDGSVTLIHHPRLRWEAHCILQCHNNIIMCMYVLSGKKGSIA